MAKEQASAPDPSTKPPDASEGNDAVVCVACGHRITDRAYRVERGGAHEHTFVNPGGFVHHIACYVAAPGVIQVGDPQSAFSWFPGHTWQIVLCSRCRSHLGWIFRGGGEQFHGLVVTQIR